MSVEAGFRNGLQTVVAMIDARVEELDRARAETQEQLSACAAESPLKRALSLALTVVQAKVNVLTDLRREIAEGS